MSDTKIIRIFDDATKGCEMPNSNLSIYGYKQEKGDRDAVVKWAKSDDFSRELHIHKNRIEYLRGAIPRNVRFDVIIPDNVKSRNPDLPSNDKVWETLREKASSRVIRIYDATTPVGVAFPADLETPVIVADGRHSDNVTARRDFERWLRGSMGDYPLTVHADALKHLHGLAEGYDDFDVEVLQTHPEELGLDGDLVKLLLTAPILGRICDGLRKACEAGVDLVRAAGVDLVRAAGVNDLVDHIHQLNVNAGWWNDLTTGEPLIDRPHVIGEKMMLVVTELAEAMEGVRKDLMDDHLPHRKMVEVELADAVIRIADLCGAMKLDLGGAITEKLRYNAQRADHKIENRKSENGKKF